MTTLQEKLLPILEHDCRVSLGTLAVMVGDTPERVKQAIEQLEKDQVILRDRPLINWDRSGRTFVEAMIEVKVTPQRDKGFDAIAKRIEHYPEVKNVYLMSGAYDLLLLVEAPTLKELAMFVSEKLSVLESVTATSTSFVLKRYKQEGVVFDEEKKDRRLLVTP
jgi:DNA-binding Lrp family transcriptional regulator